MRLLILIAILAAGHAMAENLTLIGLVTHDDGYTLRIEDTNVAISDSVANPVSLANWVGKQVEIQAQGTVVTKNGSRQITLTSITSVVVNNDE
ncbi:MAG: hypothetical protein ACI8W8_001713 [Rhodothermales bacterium]|jgi:hypothetical protein